MQVRLANLADAAGIAAIYNQGIEDRLGTFETELRTEQVVAAWFDGIHPIVVVEQEGEIVAYASSSSYRPRACYAGIVEFSSTFGATGEGKARVACPWLGCFTSASKLASQNWFRVCSWKMPPAGDSSIRWAFEK